MPNDLGICLYIWLKKCKQIGDQCGILLKVHQFCIFNGHCFHFSGLARAGFVVLVSFLNQYNSNHKSPTRIRDITKYVVKLELYPSCDTASFTHMWNLLIIQNLSLDRIT